MQVAEQIVLPTFKAVIDIGATAARMVIAARLTMKQIARQLRCKTLHIDAATTVATG